MWEEKELTPESGSLGIPSTGPGLTPCSVLYTETWQSERTLPFVTEPVSASLAPAVFGDWLRGLIREEERFPATFSGGKFPGYFQHSGELRMWGL